MKTNKCTNKAIGNIIKNAHDCQSFFRYYGGKIFPDGVKNGLLPMAAACADLPAEEISLQSGVAPGCFGNSAPHNRRDPADNNGGKRDLSQDASGLCPGSGRNRTADK
ncbi:MAG: hypothetical protein PUB51_07735 [Oscillospiraceae bacterium]|nr:hypothetical protein [Oscillospiraceae bacterium]